MVEYRYRSVCGNTMCLRSWDTGSEKNLIAQLAMTKDQNGSLQTWCGYMSDEKLLQERNFTMEEGFHNETGKIMILSTPKVDPKLY